MSQARVLILLIIAGLAACHDGPYFGTTRPLHGPDELWINNMSEPEWVDPGLCADSVGGEIILNTFAGLVQLHPKTLDPMPDVAERWEQSADGRIYTFHLRTTHWSDGTPVTAHDFAWSWKRVLDPRTASKYATFLYVVKNGAAFHQGKVLRNDVGVRALDERTLRVELEEPVPYFLALASFYTTMPVPRHVLERLAREGKNPDLWTRPEHWVSNGAYKVTEWVFRQHLRLEKNPHYWDQANVRTPKIKLAMVDSTTTALNLYRAGELDWIGTNTNLPAEFLDHLRRFKDFDAAPFLTVYWYWLNTTKPPLNDVRVRQALSLAIDRVAIVKHVKRSDEIPLASIVPDGLAGYRALDLPLFDPVRARALLAEAGYPGGAGFPEVTLIYNTSEGHKQLAEAVQQMWKKHLGVTIRLENQEWKVFLSHLGAATFDIARLGWSGDYSDPYTFLEVLSPHSGNNHSRWRDARYGEMLTEANATHDPKERLDKLREAERYMMDQVPLIPLYVYSRDHVIKPYVRGLWNNYQDRHPYKYLWIDRRWYDGVPTTDVPDEPPALVRGD